MIFDPGSLPLAGTSNNTSADLFDAVKYREPLRSPERPHDAMMGQKVLKGKVDVHVPLLVIQILLSPALPYDEIFQILLCERSTRSGSRASSPISSRFVSSRQRYRVSYSNQNYSGWM